MANDKLVAIQLDAGHSVPAGDPGAVSRTNGQVFIEYELNKKVVDFCKAYLIMNYLCTVYADYDSDVNEVAKLTRERGCACQITIHHNAGGGDGAEVYYWYSDMQSQRLASYVAGQFKAIGQNLRSQNGQPQGVKTSSQSAYNFGPCRINSANGIPAILGEFAFLDNITDRTIIDSDADLQAEGEAYAKAIADFLQLPKKVIVPVVTPPVTYAGESFLVAITWPTLNVHSTPDTNKKSVVSSVSKNQVFTIVQVKGNMGKLKSGAGWIYLPAPFTRKLK
jgi:N-acetylmuramoyl-L-alanine amidase